MINYIIPREFTLFRNSLYYTNPSGQWNKKIMSVTVDNSKQFHNIPISEFTIKSKPYKNKDLSNIVLTDKRGFDISITINNFLWLIENGYTDNNVVYCPCLYGWDKYQNIVLIPIVYEKCKEWIESSRRMYDTDNIVLNDLIEGCSYNIKNQDGRCVYIGELMWYYWDNKQSITNKYAWNRYIYYKKKSKFATFYNERTKTYFPVKKSSNVLFMMNNDIVPISMLRNEFMNSTVCGSEIIGTKYGDSDKENRYYYRQHSDNIFYCGEDWIPLESYISVDRTNIFKYRIEFNELGIFIKELWTTTDTEWYNVTVPFNNHSIKTRNYDGDLVDPEFVKGKVIKFIHSSGLESEYLTDMVTKDNIHKGVTVYGTTHI